MNVIKPYKKTKYFYIFNIILVKKSLSLNNENNSDNLFTNQTFSKSESNFSIKTSQLQRFFSNDLNDFLIAFDQQRRNSLAISSFSLLFKTSDIDFRQQTNLKPNSRRQTSDLFIFAKKVLYHNSLDPSLLSKNIDIIVITSKQLQRIINIVIDNYVQRYSFVFEFVEFFNLVESSKSQNENIDFDIIDNAEIFR